MLKALTIAAILASSTAQGEISATVIAPPATIEQQADGTVVTSGQQPLYCEKDDAGNVMCYY